MGLPLLKIDSIFCNTKVCVGGWVRWSLLDVLFPLVWRCEVQPIISLHYPVCVDWQAETVWWQVTPCNEGVAWKKGHLERKEKHFHSSRLQQNTVMIKLHVTTYCISLYIYTQYWNKWSSIKINPKQSTKSCMAQTVAWVDLKSSNWLERHQSISLFPVLCLTHQPKPYHVAQGPRTTVSPLVYLQYVCVCGWLRFLFYWGLLLNVFCMVSFRNGCFKCVK